MEKLFNSKKTYKTYDGDELLNLCIPSVNIDNITINSIGTIEKGFNGRIDDYTYKNIGINFSNIDLVMYANHIFNPFSVKEGDLIYNPLDAEVYKTPNDVEFPNVKNNENETDKERTYAEEIEHLARLGFGIK